MLALTTNAASFADEGSAVTAPIKRVERPAAGDRPQVSDLDVLVMGRYAHCTGTVPTVSVRGNPIEYRLRMGECDAETPVSSDLPQRIVGAGPADDRALLAPTRAGRIERLAPFYSLDVIIKGQHLDRDGWLDLRAAIERCVADDPELDAAAVDTLEWIADGPLLTMDIGHLEPTVEWLVMCFEAREILERDDEGAPTETRPLVGSGRTFMVRIDPEARHGRFVTIPTR